MESKKYNKLVNKFKMKQTHRYREPTRDYPEKWGGVPQASGSGRYNYCV